MDPTLKYRRLRGDMIEVFKIVHNFYDSRAVVKLNFHSFSTITGNKFKLQKFNCHYNIRKYSFVSRVVNIWNSLPDYVVEPDSLNAFKNRLDKYWSNQDVIYDYKSDLTEPDVYLFVLNVMLFEIRAEKNSCARNITLDWIGMIKLQPHVLAIGQTTAEIYWFIGFFQDGGRPPSWICHTRVWITHAE